MAETTTQTLADFLLARIAEDEAVARESHYEGQRWLSEEEGVSLWPKDEPVHMADTKRDARHIARWDPVRVLKECEAKRLIVEEHIPGDVERDDRLEEECLGCGSPWPCQTLRLITFPHAEHPGYREEWRP